MPFGACLQRFNRIPGACIRAVCSALLQVLKTLRQMPVDKALRRERDFAVFHARFQKVSDLDMDLLADVLRDHNLKFVFDCDDFHDKFSSSTVEQYDFGGPLSIMIST